MSTFIESCRCNGRQPSGVVAKKRVSRPEAVGLLLKDRAVPRFLVAPDGYGKSHIAFEYASIIFAFKHVMWLRCGSPCFVRDLDADAIRHEINAVDPSTALVVFDDVPIMDQKRSDALSHLIDELLGDGREVIVACSPSADAYGMSQKDRVLLTSRDLLLDDAEVAALGLANRPHADVACIAWGGEDAQRILKGCSKEGMPSDLKCAMLRLLVLGSGSLRDALGLFDAARGDEICQIFMRYYTFLGVKVDEDAFCAIEVTLADIKASFQASLDEVHGCTPLGSADKLGLDMADRLMRSSKLARAFAVLRSYVSTGEALSWLERHGWEAILQAEPLLVMDLLKSSTKRKAADSCQSVLLAWAAWALGSSTETKAHCRKACTPPLADPWVRAASCSLMAHLCTEPMDADETLVFAESLALLEEEVKRGESTSAHGVDHLVLGKLMLPVSLGEAIDEESWEALGRDLRAKRDETDAQLMLASMILGAAWTLEADLSARASKDAAASLHLADGMGETLVSFLQEAMEGLAGDEGASDALALPLSVAASAIEHWSAQMPELEMKVPPEHEARISQTRVRLEQQVQELRARAEETAQRQAKYDKTHPDPYRKRRRGPVLEVSSVPQLEVRMFGGLEVRIDGEAVDPHRFSRKRTRTLAAALALNKGHELSRVRICEIVWPETEPELCVNNFYSVWASLKRALTFEGSCPYLVRSQVGCSLDVRYLATDMEEFEAMCNSLVFGGAQTAAWEELYAKVTGPFADSLLPGEVDNPYISEIRERCKSRLVDGLLAVSNRLIALDERTGALWFTREALRWDDGREDVYIALMEAQITANQRGPALDTYFKCRKFLSEGLGIDPSPRLVELYRSIIEYEEAI